VFSGRGSSSQVDAELDRWCMNMTDDSAISAWWCQDSRVGVLLADGFGSREWTSENQKVLQIKAS
jgi:hypothetical protein